MYLIEVVSPTTSTQVHEDVDEIVAMKIAC